VDLLVAECTFSDDDAGLAHQYRHLTAGQAGELAAGAAAGTLVLTHFSSRYGDDLAMLAGQAAARADSTRVIAAHDLQRIAFPRCDRWPEGGVTDGPAAGSGSIAKAHKEDHSEIRGSSPEAGHPTRRGGRQ
jgi:ribonuclease Z